MEDEKENTAFMIKNQYKYIDALGCTNLPTCATAEGYLLPSR